MAKIKMSLKEYKQYYKEFENRSINGNEKMAEINKIVEKIHSKNKERPSIRIQAVHRVVTKAINEGKSTDDFLLTIERQKSLTLTEQIEASFLLGYVIGLGDSRMPPEYRMYDRRIKK